MRRSVKLLLVLMFVVMCMGGLTVTSASAANEPLFLTEKKQALLFTVDSGEAIFRALRVRRKISQ